MTAGFSIAVHGGAGGPPVGAALAHADELRSGLLDALGAGVAALRAGGDAVTAVVQAVIKLEDNPLFNAGRGSVLNEKGEVEMDASLMRGDTLSAGAVAALRFVKNPITAAQQLMNESRHVLLAGEGALAFARELGAREESLAYFLTAERQLELARALDRNSDPAPGTQGTVGAVARDREGRLAAATSTGGRTAKRPGRVGDSALIGAGTWAEDASCAVSCTGHGEAFIRTAAAHSVSSARAQGLALGDAVDRALATVARLGHDGGIIAVDYRGEIVARWNAARMFCAWQKEGAPAEFRL